MVFIFKAISSIAASIRGGAAKTTGQMAAIRQNRMTVQISIKQVAKNMKDFVSGMVVVIVFTRKRTHNQF